MDANKQTADQPPKSDTDKFLEEQLALYDAPPAEPFDPVTFQKLFVWFVLPLTNTIDCSASPTAAVLLESIHNTDPSDASGFFSGWADLAYEAVEDDEPPPNLHGLDDLLADWHQALLPFNRDLLRPQALNGLTVSCAQGSVLTAARALLDTTAPSPRHRLVWTAAAKKLDWWRVVDAPFTDQQLDVALSVLEDWEGDTDDFLSLPALVTVPV